MICQKCETSNPDQAKFCMSCGSALASVCPNCQIELPAEAKFCFKCGTAIGDPPASTLAPSEPAPSEPQQASVEERLTQYIPAELLDKLESARAGGGMQGERRVVTMLFCDVEGSTAAAESLDPEEWAEIMNGAFEHLIAPVYRYEGTLARLMGDAILAFFGAPIAHEDDPQRAVMAGLDTVNEIGPYREEVKSKWGIDFDVRVGINTGLVVVGEVGSDLRVEYTALGDAVNLAARMEQTAAPGTVQITEFTQKQIAPLYDFEDLGGIEVKGKTEPVQAFRVLNAKADPGQLRGIEGLDAPLIGREEQMATLRAAVDDLRQGTGQVFSVMGEPGLGKSRLTAELRKALDTEGLLSDHDNDGIGWHEGRSLSYETATPYAPFVSLLNGMFHIKPEQSDEEIYGSIESHISQFIPERIGEVAPFIASMLSVELTGEAAERLRYLQPPQIRTAVFQAIQALVESMATARPTILVFEDLHWVDPTSIDLIQQLLSITDRAGLMVLTLFRPWRQESSWDFHETASRDFSHRYNSVLLQPLDSDASRQLVASLLEVEDLPETVRNLILQRAEGNPFFVEEVIRSLLDAGLVVREGDHWRATREIEAIDFPETLGGIITARLDQLDDKSKRTIQTASVIGREFQFDLLHPVMERADEVEEALTDLQRRELIREKSRFPTRFYMFKHNLTQDAAYESMLLSHRRDLHKLVAECLEKDDPDKVTDIARHFVEARENALALPYVVEAGQRAARAYSTPEAIGHFKQALEIFEDDMEIGLARKAYEGLGGAMQFAGQVSEAVENYHDMFHLAERRDEPPMQISALNKLGLLTALIEEDTEAEKHLVDAEQKANQCGDQEGLAEMHMNYCFLRTIHGEFEDAVEHLNESAAIGRNLDLEEPSVFGLTHIANTQIYMAQFEEAWKAAQEAWEVAERYGNQEYQAELLAFPMTFYHIRNGDLNAAFETATRGTDMASRIGAANPESIGSFSLGQIAWLRGEYQDAVRYQENALEAAKAAGYPYLEVSAICSLGTAYLDISPSNAETTMGLHDEALEIMKTPVGRAMGAMNWADLGFCALNLGALDDAAAHFDKGLTVSTAPRLLARPQLLVGSSFVSMMQGDLEGAAAKIAEARQFAEERKMTHFYAMIDLADAQLNMAKGDFETALGHASQGETRAVEMQMRPLAWQNRATAAKALQALGREQEAETKRRETTEAIHEIASLFTSSDQRDLYLSGVNGKLSAMFGWTPEEIGSPTPTPA